MSFDILLEPCQLGPVALRNRVFTSAYTTNLGEEGRPGDRYIAYQRSRAAGGVGLIVTEAITVHPVSPLLPNRLRAHLDEAIPAYRQFTEAMHQEGTAVVAQLNHGGRHAGGHATLGAAWAPSPLPWAAGAHNPHSM
jgi:2,4-dienoyl-CoA reductase-like NADH-dependent reductase (Old Yellow Enzyme family)